MTDAGVVGALAAFWTHVHAHIVAHCQGSSCKAWPGLMRVDGTSLEDLWGNRRRGLQKNSGIRLTVDIGSCGMLAGYRFADLDKASSVRILGR